MLDLGDFTVRHIVEFGGNFAPGLTMGDGDHREIPGEGAYAPADVALGRRVESARDLIKNEKLGVAHDSARHGDALTLAARQFPGISSAER